LFNAGSDNYAVSNRFKHHKPLTPITPRPIQQPQPQNFFCQPIENQKRSPYFCSPENRPK